MRIVLVVAAVMVLSLPMAAQTPGQQRDPDRAVQGGGMFPAGWQARLDRANAKLEDAKFVTMGTGFHATTGPAGIFFNPTRTVKGDYQTKATFTQTKPSEHPEAYGLFIGGADLTGDGQRYTYFLLRQDGKYLIKRRMGGEMKNVQDWVDHAAIKKAGADGRMTNVLSIVVGKDAVKFLVNGTEVSSQPRAAVDAEGIAGLRINHNLNVHIEGFAVQSGSSH